MAESFPELLKDSNIYSRKPLNLSKINQKKYIPSPPIGKLQNTKGKKEGFYKAASEKSQIVYKGLALD